MRGSLRRAAHDRTHETHRPRKTSIMSFNNPATAVRYARAFPKASTSAGTANGPGIKVQGWRSALAVLDLGTLGASATVDVKLQESDALASGYTDITGGAFAQKVKASHDDAVASGEVNVTLHKSYLRAVVTVGAASSVVGVHVLLMNPDRTERVWAAQEASAAIATPVAESGTGATEFSV